jgi:hypothetical protein
LARPAPRMPRALFAVVIDASYELLWQ